MTGQKLFKKRAEARNDVADKLDQLMERWEQSISHTNRRLSERFLAGEIHVLIVFRDAETGEVWFVCLERNTTDNHILADRQNEAVLVGIIQITKQPKSIIPILVRLESVDSLYRFPSRTLYASSLSGFITIKGIRYRELNVCPRFGGRLTKTDSHMNEVKSQMIKGASEVMSYVSSDSRNLGRINVQWADIQKWLTSLGLVIEANQLKGCFTQRLDSRFQFIEVLLGPFNFYADQSQSVVSSHGK